MGEHRILEHTADVGIAATAASLEELFEEVTLGLLDITGTRTPPGARTETVPIRVTEGRDPAGLLVDWLSEVLYLQDGRDLVVASVEVDSVTDTAVQGRIACASREHPVEGTPVKAITYHRLVVQERDGVFTAQVFLDI